MNKKYHLVLKVTKILLEIQLFIPPFLLVNQIDSPPTNNHNSIMSYHTDGFNGPIDYI